jgi:hypothetical protein
MKPKFPIGRILRIVDDPPPVDEILKAYPTKAVGGPNCVEAQIQIELVGQVATAATATICDIVAGLTALATKG